MLWKRILKVDKIINDPNFPSPGFYDPQTDEVNLNIGHSDWSRYVDEDALIDGLEELITHEYSHKAMRSETQPIQEENIQRMRDSFLDYIYDRQDADFQEFINATTNFAETLAAEEAYAYLTATVGKNARRSLPRITESTFMASDGIMEQLMSVVNEMGRRMIEDVTEGMGVEYAQELARVLRERIISLLRVFSTTMARKLREINGAYIQFMQKSGLINEAERFRGEVQLSAIILQFMHQRIPE